MAKVTYIGIVDHATGKVCQHSDTSFVYRKKTGASWTMRREIDRDYKPSSDQLIQQECFKNNTRAVRKWIKQMPSATKTIVKKAFDADLKSATLYGFVWRHMDFDENTVTINGVTYDAAGNASVQG